MEEEQVTVERVADANVGDRLWYWDPYASQSVGGKHRRLGGWSVVVVTEMNRTSVVVERHGKFARDTGHPRSGYSGAVAGRADRADREIQERSWDIGDAVRRAPAAALREVLAILKRYGVEVKS